MQKKRYQQRLLFFLLFRILFVAFLKDQKILKDFLLQSLVQIELLIYKVKLNKTVSFEEFCEFPRNILSNTK